MATVSELLQRGTQILADAGIDDAAVDACALVAHQLKLSRLDLFTDADRRVSPADVSALDAMFARRAQCEPLAYIVGEKEFWGLTFKVASGVLIPRPDTETLVATLLAALPDKTASFHFADLGTGTGALFVSILHEYQNATGVAVDLNPIALELAQSNVETHGVSARGRVLQSDWLKDVDESFNIIVSNPPYIRPDVIETLQPDVKDYEPHSALDGGADGLCCYRDIEQEAASKLVDGGLLLLEIGYDQKDAVLTLLEASGNWQSTQCFKDFGGNDRVIAAVLNKNNGL